MSWASLHDTCKYYKIKRISYKVIKTEWKSFTKHSKLDMSHWMNVQMNSRESSGNSRLTRSLSCSWDAGLRSPAPPKFPSGCSRALLRPSSPASPSHAGPLPTHTHTHHWSVFILIIDKKWKYKTINLNLFIYKKNIYIKL